MMNKYMSMMIGVLLCGAVTTVAAQQICHTEDIMATTPADNFLVNGGVVTDKTTGLMWKRCFEGVSGDSCEAGKPQEMSWPTALLHVKKLNQSGGFAGYTDWRMPNVRELSSIVEMQCVKPALNLALFPNAWSGRTWTGSPYKFYPHYSWFVDFDEFKVDHLERFKTFSVLLVRNAF